MVKLVAALHSKCSAERRAGSTPAMGTKTKEDGMDIRRLLDQLVRERAWRIRDYNNAHPDVGMTWEQCVQTSIQELKAEQFLPAEYE